VSLKKTTRDGEKEIFILTNVPKSVASAKLIAELYRKRWSIETMFQELEAHLHSEINTLAQCAVSQPGQHRYWPWTVFALARRRRR
jgi:IS4 transposase